jgi:hypothetical protein
MPSVPFVDVEPTMRRVQSHIAETGYFPRVQIGEPKAMPVNSVLTCALFLRDFRTVSLSLAGAVYELSLWARIYVPMLQEPQERIEFALANGFLAIMRSLGADVTFGGTVRNFDPGGAYGSSADERAGYVDVGGVMCRVGDIAIDTTIDQPNAFAYAS